jgi:D-beta-D-heptose 7-phosphate kinase/D-beta-D-heptose 1-phosphate adenosyltransferase
MTVLTREAALQSVLRAFPGKKVLVVGDVMVDEYIWGQVRRISPEAPVPVVEVQRRSYAPGGAANTAANIVALSGKVSLLGVVGRDHSADRLLDALRLRGVDTDGLIADDERPTTAKTRVIGHSQQVVRIDHEDVSTLPLAVENALLAAAEAALQTADACVLSDYAKGIVSPRFAEQFIRLVRTAGKPVVVDPKGTNFTKYRGATVVKPNLAEAGQVLNQTIAGMEQILAAGARLVEILGGSAVLLTRGAQGLSLFTPDAEPVHVSAEARDVYDVTGAGDTAVGTLALALAAQATLEQAARLANRAASIVVGKLGTATVSLPELLSLGA